MPGIPWHMGFAEKMRSGLHRLGFKNVPITECRQRQSDIAILLGTSAWREIEADGKFMLVDRASFRDPEFVSLVWNGHGRRGDHNVPRRVTEKRWNQIGVPIAPWRKGRKVVLCGQTESYTSKVTRMADWYEMHRATHFRPHPAEPINPTLLPVWQTFDDVGRLLTLNSSVGVSGIMAGVPTQVDDAGGMAHPGFNFGDDRLPWLRWLAWTQWSHTEIAEGEPIRHLFEDL